MTLRVVEIHDGKRDDWDQAVSTFDHAHPLNGYGWGKVREIDGWEPLYFMAIEGDAVKGMIMVLIKKIPVIGFSIMYAPKGPLCDHADYKTIKCLVQRIRYEAQLRRTIFLRIDPNILEVNLTDGADPFINEGFLHLKQRWSYWNSPRDVYRIDLSKAHSEEELFNSIDRDARRCVRKAKKEGVTIKQAETLEELHRFYAIFSQFTVEKRFLCRKLQYQEFLWREYISKGNGCLFLAIYKEEIIGGLICMLFGGKCLAMHMGTPPQYNKLQTYYAYVWESIRWAREKGCSWYSFRGVGTTQTQESFKRKFQPQKVALVGYYDLPFRLFLYRIFYNLEFGVLPKVLRTIMQLRLGYTRIWERAKFIAVAPFQVER